MTPQEYIVSQSQERQDILAKLHSLITTTDSAVTPEVGSMMSKEMIQYKQCGYFKYGLVSVKQYISLHIMPIYMDKALHAKYEALLPNVEFQKGCINVKNTADISLPMLRQLYTDCAKIDIGAVLEARKKKTK
jgi:hypothetical protein